MIRISRARRAARGLVAILSFAIVTAAAGDVAGANSTLEPRAPAERPLVIALAAPTATMARTSPPAAIAAPVLSIPPAPASAPAPARYFTINEVMANRGQRAPSSPPVRLASIDPGQTATDAASDAASRSSRGEEPFGLVTFKAPDGLLWRKWRQVEAAIDAEQPALARCRADADECSPAAARFSAMIEAAGKLVGRARIDLVNRRVNAAIRYTSDQRQWGVADRWSAPLDTDGKGSFDTGLGDCEDYAIAKYVALREAGVAAADLRLLLVHDKSARLDHAVLASRDDGRWLMLDNRHEVLLENKDAWFFTPLFALDTQGVKLFTAPYAAQPAARVASADPAKDAQQTAVTPGEISDADDFAAREGSLSLHGSLLGAFDMAILRGSL